MNIARTWKAIAIVVAGVAVAGTAWAQAPLQVGERFEVDIRSSGPTTVEPAVTPEGLLWRLTHPGATYLAVHFADFDLAPGEELVVGDAKGAQRFVLTGRGKMDAGTFWSRHVKGDTFVILYRTEATRPDRGFRIDRYAAGFVDLGGPEAICGADDKQNAVCYASSHPTEYARSRAVARLLIQGAFLCTGWLASADNHFVTNEHCITSSSDALNTDYEFMAEAPDCGSGNCQLCWTGDIYSGASFIQDNAALDYALVQISSGDPAGTYGFLSIDDRPAVVGEEIYIPQHPGGRAKELGIESSDANDPGGVCHVTTFAPGCSSFSYNDVGYQCDTEGGSSGSPVLARSSHQVIALHHCANCPNRGVPITLVCAEICSLLGPECTTNADCDDGDACTADVCEPGGTCSNTPLANCCGNGTCESGEDCNTCSSDCISGTTSGGFCGDGICDPTSENCVTCAADCNGKQNGKPDGRFCCGDGGGDNPVDCADSRCTSGSFMCGDPGPGGSYCCGDGVCDPGEDNANCAVDCPAPFCGDGTCSSGEDSCDCAVDCGAPPPTETNCSNGVDDDCDGLTDGADPDCPSCAAKNEPCATGADCCSGQCKPNGRCK